MANRTFYPAMSYGIGRVYMDGRFTCNGASAPLTSSIDGSDGINSFAHTGGTNVITSTFKDAFYKVISASWEFVKTSAAGQYVVTNAITNEGTSTPLAISIAMFNAVGTALNDAASTNDIGFSLALKNSYGGSLIK